MSDLPTRPNTRLKLALWCLFVIALSATNFALNNAGSQPKDTNALYHYSAAVGSVLFYAIWLGIVLLLAGKARTLLALRHPPSWLKGLALAALVVVCAELIIVLIDPLLHGGREQGLIPAHWEPRHAGAYAASWVAIAVIDPFVEETMFRGLGYSLLIERIGKWATIVVVGLAFAAAHGLIQAFPEVAVLGVGLAWLRSRTDSVFPGMLVHAAFNSLALAAVFYH